MDWQILFNVEYTPLYIAGVIMTGWVLLSFMLVRTLTNHFQEDKKQLTEISAHMATTNMIMQGIAERILDAALRKPLDKSE